MSSLGEENNVQCQFERIENINLGVYRPLNCNQTLNKKHFSTSEQGIVGNYVKRDISALALYFQSFQSSPKTVTSECTPFEPVPGNNFVASIDEGPEISEGSASSLIYNSCVPLPQLSDGTLYAHLWSTDSEAGSSGTENDDVALTKRKFTAGPADQHVYEQPSSNLHTPQYATYHYNGESITMYSVSPNRDRSTLYTTFANRDSEASFSGAENGEVANTAVDNTLTENNLTGGFGQQDNAKLKKKRMRTSFEGLQLLSLENMFRENKYPDRLRRIIMAHKLKLSEKQIKIWFQNRRAKDKREKLKTRNISSMNTVPQHKTENAETAASFHFLAPIQNQNMPIFQEPYPFQYMPQPLGLNVYDFH